MGNSGRASATPVDSEAANMITATCILKSTLFIRTVRRVRTVRMIPGLLAFAVVPLTFRLKELDIGLRQLGAVCDPQKIKRQSGGTVHEVVLVVKSVQYGVRDYSTCSIETMSLALGHRVDGGAVREC
jgi:hypothetical protein